MARRKKIDTTKWMSIFIAFILISSIFGMIFGSQNESNSSEYNGFKFSVKNNAFVTKVDGEEYSFYHQPSSMQYF